MSSLYQDLASLNAFDLLRIGCGLWFIPHLIGKFTGRQFALDFFAKTGFHPPVAWLYAAIAMETVVTIGLVFDIYARYAAALGAVFLLVAAYGLYRFIDGTWRTKLNGAEFPLFWAMCCVAVALHG